MTLLDTRTVRAVDDGADTGRDRGALRHRVATVLRAAFAFAVLARAAYNAWVYYWEHLHDDTAYAVGEWLINYDGGFVRRGLFGELVFAVVPAGTPTVVALIAFQLLCYALILGFAVQYLHECRYSWSAIALVCAPVCFAFTGWDPRSGWRKEIIAFAAIVILIWARRAHGRRRRRLQYVAIAMFALAMFSWESSYFALPVMLYLLSPSASRPTTRDADEDAETGRTAAADGRAAKDGAEKHGAARVGAARDWAARGLRRWMDIDLRDRPTLAVLAIGFVGAVSSAIFRGDHATQAAICRDVIDHGMAPRICEGGISALSWTTEQALDKQADFFPRYLVYFELLPLVMAPILLSPWARRHWRWILATMIAVAPLYILGQDYGRWHYILVVTVSLAIMSAGASAVASRFWIAITTIPYVIVWGLPHWIKDKPWPRLGFLKSALQYYGIDW